MPLTLHLHLPTPLGTACRHHQGPGLPRHLCAGLLLLGLACGASAQTAGAPARPALPAAPAVAPAAAASAAAAPYQPYLRLRGAPGRQVEALAYSPDGRLLALASGQNVRLWDVARGIDLGYLGGHSEIVTALAFSPDGQQLVSGAANTRFIISEVESGNEVARVEGGLAFPRAIAFSPDGRLLALAGMQNVQLYDHKKGELLHTLAAAPRGTVYGLRFSADGQRLATLSLDGLRVWGTAAGQVQQHLKVAPGQQLLDVNARLDQGLRAGPDGIEVIDAAKGTVLARNHAGTAAVTEGRFSPDGRSVAWATANGDVMRWTLDAAAVTRLVAERPLVDANGRPVQSLAFAPNGQQLAVASVDEVVRFWGADGQHAGRIEARGPKLRSAVYSADGKLVAVAQSDGTATLLDTATGRVLPLREKPQAVAAPRTAGAGNYLRQGGRVIDISPDGRSVAAVSGGQLRLFGRATGQEIAVLGPAEARDLRYTRDGRWLLVLEDAALQVWDAAARLKVQQITLDKAAQGGELAFDPSGSQLWLWAMSDSARSAWIEARSFGPNGLGAAQRIPVPGLPPTLGKDDHFEGVFSPDGRLLALSRPEETRVIELSSGRVLMTLTDDMPWYATRQFSPDGRQLLAFGSTVPDNAILRWDTRSGQALPPFTGHDDTVRSVAWGPAGRPMLSGGDCRTLWLWDAADGVAVGSLGLYADRGWAVAGAEHYEVSSPAHEDAVLLRRSDTRADIVPAATQRQRLRPGLLRQLLQPLP